MSPWPIISDSTHRIFNTSERHACTRAGCAADFHRAISGILGSLWADWQALAVDAHELGNKLCPSKDKRD
jgi:hypothetical protein